MIVTCFVLLAMVAPVSAQGIVGLQRAEVKQGIRMVVLCKDGKGKLGLRIKSVSKVRFSFYHRCLLELALLCRTQT